MKNLCVVAVMAIFSFIGVNAQGTDFGATAGFISGNEKFKSGGESLSASESGFYVGIIAEIDVTEEFKIQPELLYAKVGEISFLQLPIIAKYYVSEKFNLLAGPQITYTLENEVGDDVTKLNLGLGLGLGYDFTEKLFVQSRYAFQLNDYYTGNEDLSSKIGFLNIGLGYRF